MSLLQKATGSAVVYPEADNGRWYRSLLMDSDRRADGDIGLRVRLV
jgi:hypothetical protein